MRPSSACVAAILVVLVSVPPSGAEARSRREESADGTSKGAGARGGKQPNCVPSPRKDTVAARESLGDLLKHSKDPMVLTRQLHTAVLYFQQALRVIGEVPPEQTNEAALPIYLGYVLVRSAHAGVDSRIADSKFPDPVLKQKFKTIWDARRAILAAHRYAEKSCPGPREAENATYHLGRGIAIMQAVLRGGI
jgi:hypothetical protein